MNQSQTDERWMRLALTLGQRGLGIVWPNPAVGCVLVKNNRVVARGWTQPGGRPHAEAHALAQAGGSAIGATAYVTLEPCSHQGKTGPCVSALITAGVRRVVSACEDPDPRVNGKGHAMLRDAGIDVEIGVLSEQAVAAHLGFFTKAQHDRPMVTLKLASSLDGRIATQTGDSRWITGPASRRAVHLMRAQHDAIMVGRNTVEKDDPNLTVRGMGLQTASPIRVVLDTHLRLPASGRLADTARQTRTWMLHGPTPQNADAWAATGASLFQCKTAANGSLDIADALQTLAGQGITRLMVEGGGTLAASLLRENLVDRLALFQAGVTIGAEGLPNLANLGLSNLSDAPRFQRKSLTAIGNDVLTVWEPT